VRDLKEISDATAIWRFRHSWPPWGSSGTDVFEKTNPKNAVNLGRIPGQKQWPTTESLIWRNALGRSALTFEQLRTHDRRTFPKKDDRVGLGAAGRG